MIQNSMTQKPVVECSLVQLEPTLNDNNVSQYPTATAVSINSKKTFKGILLSDVHFFPDQAELNNRAFSLSAASRVSIFEKNQSSCCDSEFARHLSLGICGSSIPAIAGVVEGLGGITAAEASLGTCGLFSLIGVPVCSILCLAASQSDNQRDDVEKITWLCSGIFVLPFLYSISAEAVHKLCAPALDGPDMPEVEPAQSLVS
mgnify:FL=1